MYDLVYKCLMVVTILLIQAAAVMMFLLAGMDVYRMTHQEREKTQEEKIRDAVEFLESLPLDEKNDLRRF